MTLSTSVAILRATVPPRDLFHLGRGWLGCTDEHTYREEPRHPVWGMPDAMVIGNRLGQGLPAIWEVRWKPDQPWRVSEHVCERDEDGNSPDPDCNEYDCDPGPACAYEAWFDTTYSYRAPNDADCGDLHAWLITKIARVVGGDNILWEADTIGDYLPYRDLRRLGDADRGSLEPAEATS